MPTSTGARSLAELFQALESPGKRVVLVPHVRPDNDAIGACLGLAQFLEQLGHRVQTISPSEVPAYFGWLPGADAILNAAEAPGQAQQELAEAGLIFCLDYGSPARAGELEKPLLASPATRVNIDHHRDFTPFAEYELRDITASSTCELIYRFIHDSGRTELLTPAVAETLYSGILTDTGGFRYNTSAATHQVVAGLMAAGCDVRKVSHFTFNNYTLNRLRFYGFCLQERLQHWPGLRTAVIPLSAADLDAYAIETGGTEGLVNYALSLQGVNLGVLLKETNENIKLSFRSVGQFPANELAAEFAGGGHFNAAGGQSDQDLAGTLDHLKALLHGPFAQQLHYTPFD